VPELRITKEFTNAQHTAGVNKILQKRIIKLSTAKLVTNALDNKNQEAAEGRTAHNGWNSQWNCQRHGFHVVDPTPLTPFQP
jgi:hypothetical protein